MQEQNLAGFAPVFKSAVGHLAASFCGEAHHGGKEVAVGSAIFIFGIAFKAGDGGAEGGAAFG